MKEQTEHIKHAKLVKPQWVECPPVNGLILAGGESRRMGTDKSSIEYHGLPQREYLAEVVRNFVGEVYLSCHPSRVPETSLPVITDTFLDLGPYGGLLSAFRFNPNCAWLVTGCDMPLINEIILSQLIRERDIHKVATCFYDPATGLPEPLLTIWEPKAYPLLLQGLGQGTSCLRKMLTNSDVKQLQPIDPVLLRNANTLEDAAAIRKIMDKGVKNH